MKAAGRYLAAGGGARTLVFVHGVGTDATAWTPQLEFFSKSHRAVAWNLPGYGGTPLPATPSFHGMADALRDLVDELAVERIDLVGHSYGGMVALEFVARHPGRLRSLILSGTSPAFGRPDGEWQQKFVRDRLAPIEAGKTMADLADGMVKSLTGPNADPAGLSLARTSIAQVPTATFAAGIRTIVTFDRRDALAKIAVPTLVLAGAHDTNAPAPMMEKMAQKIPTAEYFCLPGVGHLANLENPQAFNQAVGEFLART